MLSRSLSTLFVALPLVHLTADAPASEPSQEREALVLEAEPRWLADFATEYLTAIATDDVDLLANAIGERYAPAVLGERGLDGWIELHMGIAGQLEDFDRYHVAVADVDQLEVLTRHTPDGTWLSWVFQVQQGTEFVRGVRVVNAVEPELWAPDFSGLTTAAIAEKLRVALGSPALGLGIARIDGANEAEVVGRRRSDEEAPAQVDDKFHLGSCSKTTTAMLVGQLVGEGLLDWESTLGELLGDDFELHDSYREVSLFDVARHRAGIVGHSDDIADAIDRYSGLPGSTTEQRAAYLADVLKLPPVVKRGRMHYSNAGFCLLAHVCERVLELPFEEALRERIFGRLDLHSGGFGWPARVGQPDGIWGHGDSASGELEPFEEELVLGAFLAPAGDMHLTIGDFAEVVLQHALGPRGESPIASADVFAAIHSDYPGANGGAGVGKPRMQGLPGFGHVGSTGIYWSRFLVVPSLGLAVVVATNAPVTSLEERAVTAALRAIVQGEVTGR